MLLCWSKPHDVYMFQIWLLQLCGYSKDGGACKIVKYQMITIPSICSHPTAHLPTSFQARVHFQLLCYALKCHVSTLLCQLASVATATKYFGANFFCKCIIYLQTEFQSLSFFIGWFVDLGD